MSLNWIQLIGLLLVSQFARDNNAIVLNNSGPNLSKVLEFKCENDKSLLIKRDDINRFNQIQILTSSQDTNCKLLFNGHNDEVQILFNNDVKLMTSHTNGSSQCGELKFEESSKSLSTHFCLAAHDDLNKLENVYTSSSSNLTLYINLNSFRSNDSVLRIHYRFSKTEIQETLDFLDFQKKKFICDHLFKQCNTPIQCRSSSELADVSNFTCNYLIRHQNQSTNNRILISSNKQFQYQVNNRSDCLDSIEFYDGSEVNTDKLIIKLCPPFQAFPLVRSESSELFVVYRFSNSEPNEKLELIAESQNKKSRSTRLAERSRRDSESCNVYYNASTTSQRSGQIIFKNQLQDQPKDQPCFIHLLSSNPFDRIWFYFLNYRPASLLNANSHGLSHFESSDSCRITELRLYDSSDEQVNFNNLLSKGKSFCGANQPRTCNPARQQCFLPSDSYLSTGPRLSLMSLNKVNPSLYLLPLQFTLNYEFVNIQENGEAVPGTICDRLFDSTKYRHGTVRSTRNLFLYGRGGVRNLNCAYIFRGQPNQRLRIQLYRIKVKSSDCLQQRDPNSGTNKCVLTNKSSNGPSSRFSVWDFYENDVQDNHQDNIRIPVDCFFNNTVKFLTPISFNFNGCQ